MNTRVPRTPKDWDQAAKGTPFEGMGATLHRLATRVYCTRCCSVAHNVTHCPYPEKSVDLASKARQDRSMDTNKVTRFEVIDHTTGGEGRAYVKHDVSVELSYQDDGRTLKVFVGDRKAGDD